MLDKQVLKSVLNQFGGPIKVDYSTTSQLNITKKLITYHKDSIDNVYDYTASELYSLHSIIEYALKDLGVNEFNTVTGYDLYSDGYKLLTNIHKLIEQTGTESN